MGFPCALYYSVKIVKIKGDLGEAAPGRRKPEKFGYWCLSLGYYLFI
jgi:hypothetical protein